MKPGDVLVEVEGRPVADPTSMLNLIAALPPGKPATVKVKRSGQEIDATITVGRRPEAAGARGRDSRASRGSTSSGTP